MFGKRSDTAEGEYLLRPSARAKRIRVVVERGGQVVVVVPARIPRLVAVQHATRLLRQYAPWVASAQARMARVPQSIPLGRGRKAYLAHKEEARRLAEELVPRFARQYGVQFGRISIRDQRSRWGSCSRVGNLNFNYRIALLPRPLAEYVIVHEVCHLLAHDHSPKFWALVAREVADYPTKRRALRGYALG